MLLKDRELRGPGQVPHLCRVEEGLPSHVAHPSSCPTENTKLAAFECLTRISTSLLFEIWQTEVHPEELSCGF